jgi:hypothetical protein
MPAILYNICMNTCTSAPVSGGITLATWKHHPITLMTSFLLLLLSVVPAIAIGEDKSTPQPPGQSVPVAELDPQPVLDWMSLVYNLIEAEAVNAPAAARLYGYTGVAVYEALLPGMPDNLSLAGQIIHMPDMPLPAAEQVYDWLSVANAAISTTFDGLMFEATTETHDRIAQMRATQAAARSALVGQVIVQASLAYGDQIAAALLDWIEDDNYRMTRSLTWELPVGEGLWEITTPGARPVEPLWGSIRPFALEWVDECAVYPDVPYSTDPASTYYIQAQEVVDVARNLTPEQQETARYWVDTPGITGTPAGHWWSIANQLVTQKNLPLPRAAEMYAMLGVTLADSFISCWSLKYQTLLMRPVTFIQQNMRRAWEPYIESPPFPEYPSGHSVVSAAAAETFTRLFGASAFTDETHLIYDHEPLRRSYTSFEAAAYEAAISRLYGGIHYRSAIENGMRQGRCVAQRAFQSIRLNPVLQGE